MKNILKIGALMILVQGCGPIADPVEQQCEQQGGEWVCSQDAPGGRERCWCDIAPEGDPS